MSTRALLSLGANWCMAMVLPGLAALYALTFWLNPVHQVFKSFFASPSLGFMLLMILLSACLGMQLSVFSWLLYEKLLCRGVSAGSLDLLDLDLMDDVDAYRLPVRFAYRRYQFLAAMTFVLPLYFGVLVTMGYPYFEAYFNRMCLGFVLVEVPTVIGAVSAYHAYVSRGTRALKRSRAYIRLMKREEGSDVSDSIVNMSAKKR